MNRIGVTAHEKGAALNPIDFLGGEFSVYLAACKRGKARFDKPTKSQVCKLEHVGKAVRALEEAGFDVEIDEALKDHVEAPADKAPALDIEAMLAELAARDLHPYPFQVEGIRWLSEHRRGLLGDEMGLGKQQPTDSFVLTPKGWREIGAIGVGDRVVGSGGQPTTVTGVFPQGVKPVFRVRFSDHSWVEAGADHLWSVDYRRGGRRWARLTLTTEQLRTRPVVDGLDLSKTALRLPMLSAAASFDPIALPVPPYTLGQLIANGGTTSGTPVVTSHADDHGGVVAAMRKEGSDVSAPRSYGGMAARSHVRGVAPAVRALGLNVPSRDKRIPRAYFTAAPADRVALLQGLMDADGSCSSDRNRLIYHTTSEGLASDVRELVECLGGIASVRAYERAAEGKPTEYHVRLRLPSWVLPFRSERKASRYQPGSHARPCRTVRDVEYTRTTECVCIAVDAPDRLYVTEHAILTHNTIQTLLAAPRAAPVLVICPASLKLNWRKEARVWRPDLRVSILKGRDSFRWPSKTRKGSPRPEMVVTNWDVLGPVEDEGYVLPEAPAGVVVIADEAQAVKNNRGRRIKVGGKTKNLPPLRTSRWCALAKAADKAGGCLWPMTGTPIENRPIEIWNILNSVGLAQETFGGWRQFVRAFGGYQGEWGMQWGQPTAEVPRMLRATMLRRERQQVLPDLPVKTWSERTVAIDDETRALCDDVQRQLKAAGIDLDEAIGKAAAYNPADALARLQMAIPFEAWSAIRAALATAKIPGLLDVVAEFEDGEEPLIVASKHRAPVDTLGKRDGWATITGDTPNEKRQQVVDAFQAGDLKGVALTIKAGGTGLTLTRAAFMLFVDKEWTPSANAQAEDRICRIGQDRGCQIISLVADHPVDERVDALLAGKQALIDNSIRKATTDGAAQTGGRTYARRPERALHGPSSGAADQPAPSRFRGPSTPLEEWAAETLQAVAAADPDRAAVLNGVAFNAADGEFGHSLADQVRGRGLTEKQWALARRLANKYRRQAPSPQPEEEERA